MVGAVAGSPGTLPTNWLYDGGTLAYSVTGVGVENGLAYTDIRVNGTANSNRVRIIFEGGSIIAASNGQTWSLSPYVRVTNATSPPLNYNLQVFENTSAGAFVTAGSAAFTPTANLTRYNFVRTLSGGATVGAIQPMIQISLTVGATYDFTIRIAAPQMELGAYATTFIPTTTAAVTRLADAASKTGVSSLIGQTEGTLFFDFELPSTNQSSGRIYTINDTTSSNVIRTEIFALSSTVFQFRTGITTGGVDQGDFFTTITQLQNKIAVSYGLNDVKIYINGALAATDTTVNIPATSAIYLANRSNVGNFAAVSFNQAALYTTRLSNEQLQALTTL